MGAMGPCQGFGSAWEVPACRRDGPFANGPYGTVRGRVGVGHWAPAAAGMAVGRNAAVMGVIQSKCDSPDLYRPDAGQDGGELAESILLGVLGVVPVLGVHGVLVLVTWEIDPHCYTAVHDHESANSDGYPPEGRHLLCKIGD